MVGLVIVGFGVFDVVFFFDDCVLVGGFDLVNWMVNVVDKVVDDLNFNCVFIFC